MKNLRNKLNKRARRGGFTLIEIVIAIAVLAIVSTGTYLLIDSIRSAAIKSDRIFFSSNAADSAYELFKSKPESFCMLDENENLAEASMSAGYYGIDNISATRADEGGYTLSVYYDSKWQPCQSAGAFYVLRVTVSPASGAVADGNGNITGGNWLFDAAVSTAGGEAVYSFPNPMEIAV